MKENEVSQYDDISLFDLWVRLRDGWKVITGGLVLGMAAAAAAISQIPAKYQAVGVIQVGQVGQVGQIGKVGQVGQVKVTGVPVEPPSQAIERMKTPTFQRRIAERLGDQEWLQQIGSSAAGGGALSLQIIKGTVGPEQVALVELRTEAKSPDAAKLKFEAVVGELVKVHAELAKPAIDRMREDLAINREKLQSAERDIVTLSRLVEVAGVKDDRFTQLALMTSLRIEKEGEKFERRQMISVLETALNAPATQSARAIEAVFVPERPVSPKKSLLIALGCLGGGLLGVVLVFFREAWRRSIEERAGSGAPN